MQKELFIVVIAVDIGNSFITIGYFVHKRPIVQNIRTKPRMKMNEYCSFVNTFMAKNRIEKYAFNVIISSVVSSHTASVRNAFKKLFGDADIVVVTHKMKTGLDLKVNQPERFGTDRLANAAGAYARYGPLVAVVDFGTATTITVVGRKADILGGSIMPGLSLMNTALAAGTGKLRKISLAAPKRALGKDTAQCIASGILIGTAGAVDRIIDEIERESGERYRTVITGGHCHMVSPFLKRSHNTHISLTLEGLKAIYDNSSAT